MAYPLVICYPTPGKAKAFNVCKAFADGAKGQVWAGAMPTAPLPGSAFFYGVVGATESIWNQCKAGRYEWFYADNSYFDCSRQRYFRVTRNAMQMHPMQPSQPVSPDYARLRRLGATVAPWRTAGGHVVVCQQSDAYMRLCGYSGNWLADAVRTLQSYTDRPLRIRKWNRDKKKASASLQTDLKGAWALVTHTSAAANEALLAGVPVIVTGECAAAALTSSISHIEEPHLPLVDREEWAAGLAANQWTLEEMSSGKCWSDINAKP